MTTWADMNLQDSASPIMEQLIYFHDYALMIITLILMVISYMIYMLIDNNFINRFLIEGQFIEMVWTMAPAIILIFIAIPSLRLLYLMDEINNPMMTLKTIGHQWYWSYEYSDFLKTEFDSYMITQNELSNFRLLDVDNRVTLPMNTFIRVIITASDVLHAWTIPSLGIKADAIPGRLNQISFIISRPGIFFGQCSEICGMNHSFMPIVIESISINNFMKWISKIN
uniref:cytochrome c oxidase subunit II n=1 Tax=Pseudoglomeris beybienkoi TaxID=3035026 RepID=UPI001E6F681E|nr:cytochrome c oxidase subunit II [Pseudoglomeris beybienkoi]UGY85178.1 cytochrome c oxidase subunit 2 [Pseudoglomeris magnifica]WGO57485.1 cytochrome c oxidase subunit II [Pseudoglomeris beybienkoi]